MTGDAHAPSGDAYPRPEATRTPYRSRPYADRRAADRPSRAICSRSALIGLAAMAASATLTIGGLAGLTWWVAHLPMPWLGAPATASLVLAAAWTSASGRPRARPVALVHVLRSRRAAVYGGLIDLRADPAAGDGVPAALRELERQLALIGSRQVLTLYVACRDDDGAGAGAEARLGALIAVMRRDLLPGRSRIDPGTLARLARPRR